MVGQEFCSPASFSKLTPSAVATAITGRGEEALAVPPAVWEAASDPKGTFTLAAVAGPAAGTACGGLDIRSATMFRWPGTWMMSAVNSADYDSWRCCLAVREVEILESAKVSGLWSLNIVKPRPSRW